MIQRIKKMSLYFLASIIIVPVFIGVVLLTILGNLKKIKNE
ncbi:hypothetical protein SAMN02745174_02584 [Cetobacterium ceti]|uniref:Uncharacterized protein n=1 Tax=Cetobacterium ceti TaxID=180163 RepID=A0A1T4R5J3_9FUSO|nr:hypothetical protein SAMN02745174_02584 [Cetobacterium ceti]